MLGSLSCSPLLPSGGSGSYTGYQWYVGAYAQSGQTESTFNFAPAFSDSYSITVTVNDSSSATSAPSTAALVEVNTPPTVSIATVGSLTLDEGQVKVFTATASGGSGSLSYQWYLDGSAVGTHGASYSYTAITGLHSVNCKVTDSASIPFTSPVSNTLQVAGNPTLVAPAVTSIPGTIDQSQNSSLTSASISTGTSPYTYQWFAEAPGAGSYSSISGANSISYSFATSGSTITGAWSFDLKVTDATGIAATSTAASVMVNAAPTVSIAPVGPITLTVGQGQAFTATATGGSGSLSYQWYLDGSAVGTNSASYSYTATQGSHSVTCQVTDSASPPITSPVSNSVSVTVNTTPTPTPTATPITTTTPTSTAVSTPSPTPTNTPKPTAVSTPSPTPTSITSTPSPSASPGQTPKPSTPPAAIYGIIAAIVIVAIIAVVLVLRKKQKTTS